MKSQTSDLRANKQPSCNVSSKFNFTVGGLAIAVAGLIGYLAYARWW